MNASAQTLDQATEHAIITVRNTKPSPGPRRSASVFDTDGVMYGIWPDKLAQIAPGESYEIEFTSKIVNGVTFRDIKQFRVATPPGPAPRQFTAQHQPQPRPLSSAATQPGEKNGSSNGAYYRPTSPRDARRMFLCSTLNAFISTGRIDPHRDHLKQVIVEILAAYDATVGLEDQA